MTDTRPTLRWFKSTRSGGSGGNCVECAFAGHDVYLRDSKDPAGPVLTLTPSNWTAFTSAVKSGAYDATRT